MGQIPTPEQIDMMKLMGVEACRDHDDNLYEAWLDGECIAISTWSMANVWEKAWQLLNKSE